MSKMSVTESDKIWALVEKRTDLFQGEFKKEVNALAGSGKKANIA